MSISTTCIGTSSCRSASSAGMSIHATPRSGKGTSTANTLAEVKQNSPAVYEGWKAELKDRIHVYPKSVKKFLETFVPSSHPYTLTDDVSKAFSQFRSRKGKEVKSYPGLITGLNKLVSSFDAEHKPSFHNTRKLMMPFPFADFAENHHASSPDIAVGFPGANTSDADLEIMEWQGICIAMEVKSTAEKDPFVSGRTGKENNRTAIQLSRNARNLLLSHGFLAAFVIGIYGDNVRIARYDHTCAVVSQPFSLRKNPRLLQRFFWNFAHPMIGRTVVGCDPTIRKLNAADQDWIKSQLEQAQEDVTSLTREIGKGRRVVVFNEADETYKTYLLYHLVDVNARLFSRATTVWRAMEDTRDPNRNESQPPSDDSQTTSDDSQTTQSSIGSAPAKTVIFKEAWRQLVRTPETEFYKRMSVTFGDDKTKWHGLARFMCGGDQGQEEVRQWERSSPNVSAMEGQRDLRLPTGLGTQDAPFELPYPQHQTFSWTLAVGQREAHRERSQIRIVVEDVGRPLTRFTSTFELVCAIMAAIEGHRTAWEIARIMHRDVSLGNILISSDPERKGFLHDFDYSSMGPLPPEFRSAASASEERLPSDDSRKERTGTYYYMAIEILAWRDIIHEIHHDLESFYWVLMWVVLRHTEHCLGQEYCTTLFKFGDDKLGADAKRSWIHPYTESGQRRIDFQVENNAPLTALIEDFRVLLSRSRFFPDAPPPVPLNYDSVLAIFRKAVERTDWPEDDFVHCHLLKKTIETAIIGAPGDETVMGSHGEDSDEGVDVDVAVPLAEEDEDDDMEAVDMDEVDEENDGPERSHEDDPADGAPALDDAPAPDDAPVVDNAAGGDPQPQQQGPMTRSRAKRNAAGDVAPAPSGSGGSSKRRKTNPSQPPVARKGSGSRSRGKKTSTTRRGSGGRGRR
ncbi:hypothetical protein C8T65DRAFT_739487 [Cerioporus squamosus]|nr:hypothetical protein C8T65DRAFT_739487 [Cerioporus squamosus]